MCSNFHHSLLLHFWFGSDSAWIYFYSRLRRVVSMEGAAVVSPEAWEIGWKCGKEKTSPLQITPNCPPQISRQACSCLQRLECKHGNQHFYSRLPNKPWANQKEEALRWDNEGRVEVCVCGGGEIAFKNILFFPPFHLRSRLAIFLSGILKCCFQRNIVLMD